MKKQFYDITATMKFYVKKMSPWIISHLLKYALFLFCSFFLSNHAVYIYIYVHIYIYVYIYIYIYTWDQSADSSCFALWELIGAAQIKWRSWRIRVLKLLKLNLNHEVLVSHSEHYDLLKITRYLNSASTKSFFPYCTPVFLSEVESVDFYQALFVLCFRHTFQHLKISILQ